MIQWALRCLENFKVMHRQFPCKAVCVYHEMHALANSVVNGMRENVNL